MTLSVPRKRSCPTYSALWCDLHSIPQVEPPPENAGPSYRLAFASVGDGLVVSSYSLVSFGFVYNDTVRLPLPKQADGGTDTPISR